MSVICRHDGALLRAREEVHEVRHTLLVDVPRLQDSRRWEILLFGRVRCLVLGSDAEVTALILVQQAAED